MPPIQSKIEGRGNGIKTNVVNMVDVAKALARPASYTTKYFGCELGAQTKFDEKSGLAIVNGAHDARVARLDAKEDELRQLEQGACNSTVKAAVDAEYKRNRTRVIEIWNLCHVVNKNELKADRFED